MSQLPENEDLKTELFQFFDKYGIAYKYNSGISINLDLYEEFDTTERLLKGLFTQEEAIDNENWSSFSNIEFITPLIFRNKIEFLGNTYYRLVVDDYLKDTFNLHLSKFTVEEIKKIGLLNITSYHGQSLSNSKLYNSNWGYNFNGIIAIPRKFLVGDISIDNSEIYRSIEVVDGDVIINSEIETFGGLTHIHGDLRFSLNITQNKLKSFYPLEIIDGNCYLKKTRVCLDSINIIGGDLNIRRCYISQINPKIKINGNLLISKYNFNAIEKTLGELAINGKIKKYSDPFDVRFTDDNWLENIIENIF